MNAVPIRDALRLELKNLFFKTMMTPPIQETVSSELGRTHYPILIHNESVNGFNNNLKTRRRENEGA